MLLFCGCKNDSFLMKHLYVIGVFVFVVFYLLISLKTWVLMSIHDLSFQARERERERERTMHTPLNPSESGIQRGT